MELELGLAPPNARLIKHHDELSGSSDSTRGKRGFTEAFHETTATLPLFDDGSCRRKKSLVGWPPVRSARSRDCGGANYVKVKKEGDAIGRKVGLSLHASYDELLATLARMFPATSFQSDEKEISNSTSLVVTYEDGEGDWMLVGDVPWDDFARSVKRLKILG
ncbi:auxin-responsive protein IAA9-like [Phragmites australis]|uniref:auxin-responsive protein IAA9-like n=1 Tax=Phragmites australis TaxID=29695 RepID=UPI002D789BDF|nr:auxin-responsive protein IAA9-like [Phragmites australis]